MSVKLRIITPGKHDASVLPLLAEYEKRISRFAHIEWVHVASGDASLEISGLKKALADTPYFVFDERGKSITTEHIAETIEKVTNQSQSTISFVIGGAYGLDDELRAGAVAIWAFGAITLPHQLVRLVTVEQLYRAMTILNNHPYHHAG